MEARNGAAGNGREEHRDDREGLRIGDAVFEGGEFRNGVFAAEKQHDEDADGHEQQREAEDRVDAADDLVDGQQRGGDVVDENHAQHDQQQPRESAESDAFKRRDVEAGRDERCGLREEHRTDEDHQPGGKEPHDDLHAAAEVDPGRLGKTRAVVAQRDDPGDEVMRRTHEDAAEGDPQKRHRPVGRTEHGAENRAEPRNVEQLDQENAPPRQGHVIHAVVKAAAGRPGRRVDADEPFQIASIREICGHQQRQAHQKSNHRKTVSGQF